MRWATTNHWWEQLTGREEWVCVSCGSRSKRVGGVFYEHRSGNVGKCEQLLEGE